MKLIVASTRGMPPGEAIVVARMSVEDVRTAEFDLNSDVEEVAFRLLARSLSDTDDEPGDDDR